MKLDLLHTYKILLFTFQGGNNRTFWVDANNVMWKKRMTKDDIRLVYELALSAAPESSSIWRDNCQTVLATWSSNRSVVRYTM